MNFDIIYYAALRWRLHYGFHLGEIGTCSAEYIKGFGTLTFSKERRTRRRGNRGKQVN